MFGRLFGRISLAPAANARYLAPQTTEGVESPRVSPGAPSGLLHWRNTSRTPQEQEREERIIDDPLHEAERPVLIEFQTATRAARSDQDYFDVQQRRIARMKARQELIAELRVAIATMAEQRATLAAEEPKPIAELRELQGQIAIREHQLRVQDALRYLLLGVGDALAWKRLGYDRASITILGQGTPVTWLFGRSWLGRRDRGSAGAMERERAFLVTDATGG